MKFWSYVNGGFRATQNAWAQHAYQLRQYVYAPANVARPIDISRQVQTFEVAPGDASSGAAVVPAPQSQPPGGL